MKTRAVHYAGGLKYLRSNGAVVTMLAGWPACCCGERAQRIASEGFMEWKARWVTCKSCLKLIARAAAIRAMED